MKFSLFFNWRLPLSLFLVSLAALTAYNATWTAPFGTTQLDGDVFHGKWYWTYIDYYADAVNRPVLQGWYWLPDHESGGQRWRLTASGAATLYLNGEKIYEGAPPAGKMLQEVVEVPLKAGSNFYRYEVIPHTMDGVDRLLVALEEPALGGWQYLRHSRLYPNEPGSDPGIKNTPQDDQRRVQEMLWLSRLVLLSLLWLIAVVLVRVWPRLLMLNWKRSGFYLAVFLLALIPRVILVLDRAARDPEFYRLLPGTDNYIYLGRAVLSGGYSIAGTLWGPGNIVWMTQFQRWFGPALLPIHMTNAVLGALVCPFLVDITRRLYGWRAAKGTALLVALYAPLILYQTSAFVEGIGTTLTFVMLWLLTVYLQATPPLHWPSFQITRQFWLMVGLGVSLGVLGLFRPTLLIFALILPLILLIKNSSPIKGEGLGVRVIYTLWRTLPVAFFALLTIYPMTHANYVYGTKAFISANGPQTFHIGNNETSAGDASFSVTFNSVKARGINRTDAIIDGFKDSPKRAIELMLRKVGLTWRTYEDGHLIDLNRSGRTASPFFGVLYHLNTFSTLAFIGLTGLFLTDYRQPIRWMLPLSLVLYTAATAAVEAITRLRIQLVLPLMVSGGYTLSLLPLLSQKFRSSPSPIFGEGSGVRIKKGQWFTGLKSGVMAALLLLLLYLMETQFPRPRYFAPESLPEGTLPLEVTFDDSVKLIGYQPLSHDARSDGVLAGRLYFARVGEVQKDYLVSVIAILPDERVIFAGDWPLGHTGYPRINPENWPEGRGLRDEYFIELPIFNVEKTGVITLGMRLYTEESQVTATGSAHIRSDGLVILKTFGVIHPEDAVLESATPQAVTVGETFALIGSRIPETASAGETITVSVLWRGLKETNATHQRFLVLMDSQGKIVSQQDGAMFSDSFPSSALLPEQTLRADMPFALPDNLPPAKYTLGLGLYTWPDILRLPAVGDNNIRLPEDIIPLGTLEIRAP